MRAGWWSRGDAVLSSWARPWPAGLRMPDPGGGCRGRPVGSRWLGLAGLAGPALVLRQGDRVSCPPGDAAPGSCLALPPGMGVGVEHRGDPRREDDHDDDERDDERWR